MLEALFSTVAASASDRLVSISDIVGTSLVFTEPYGPDDLFGPAYDYFINGNEVAHYSFSQGLTWKNG
jgi:hypothetical protein